MKKTLYLREHRNFGVKRRKNIVCFFLSEKEENTSMQKQSYYKTQPLSVQAKRIEKRKEAAVGERDFTCLGILAWQSYAHTVPMQDCTVIKAANRNLACGRSQAQFLTIPL
uniref:Uncharacterized protein n=1 Tax=Sphaerodactylus townsendi TaxID=933632 RepID=A0ACB8EHG2_9SAUR